MTEAENKSEVKVTVETLSPVLRKVEVEVPAQTVDVAFDRAYREVGRRARIKGFRPGRAPRRVLERYFGHDVVHEVADRLVRETWPQAVAQEQLEPVATPQVEESGHARAGSAFTYVAKVEVMPEVKVTTYEGLSGQTYPVKVEDTEIDAEIERLRQAMAQLVPVEDRDVVEEGDFISADVEATVEGEPFPPGSGEGIVFEVSDGEVTRGHLPEAQGAKVGDVVEVDRTFPDDDENKDLRGKTVHFAAQIKEIRRKEVPEADDELAKDLGEEGIDSLMALRGHIRQRLLDERKAAAERKLKDSLVQDLVEKNPFDVPASVVDRAAEAMVQPYLRSMLQAGIEAETLARNIDLDGLLASARPAAERMVKGALLLRAVAEAESLSVDDAAVEAHYQKLSEQSGETVEKVKEAFEKDPDARASLERQLLEDRALAFIRERASIEEIEPEAAVGEGPGDDEAEGA